MTSRSNLRDVFLLWKSKGLSFREDLKITPMDLADQEFIEL